MEKYHLLKKEYPTGTVRLPDSINETNTKALHMIMKHNNCLEEITIERFNQSSSNHLYFTFADMVMYERFIKQCCIISSLESLDHVSVNVQAMI